MVGVFLLADGDRTKGRAYARVLRLSSVYL